LLAEHRLLVPMDDARLAESFEYFLDKGFLKVAFSLAGDPGWEDPERLAVLGEQMEKVLRLHAARVKKDDRYYVLRGGGANRRRDAGSTVRREPGVPVANVLHHSPQRGFQRPSRDAPYGSVTSVPPC
jgi:hypothetical protein